MTEPDPTNQPQPGTDILDAVTGMTIPAPIKKSIFKALAKLIYGVVDIPVAWLEGVAGGIRVESEAKRLVTMAAAEAAAKRIGDEPHLVDRAIARFGAKIVTQQKIIEQVSRLAIEYVSSQAQVGAPSGEISDDWLTRFAAVAENATTHDMQTHYGRILGGELLRPGSYDPATFSILSLLSQQVARDFELICRMSMVIQGRGLVLLSISALNNPTTTSNAISDDRTKGEDLRPLGLSLVALLGLRSAGLLASLPDEEYPDLTEQFDGRSIPYAGSTIRLDGSEQIERHEKILWTNVISLTKAGNELRSILSLEPLSSYTTALQTMAARAGVAVTFEA